MAETVGLSAIAAPAETDAPRSAAAIPLTILDTDIRNLRVVLYIGTTFFYINTVTF